MTKHVLQSAMHRFGKALKLFPWIAALGLTAVPGHAALTDLATGPLANSTTAVVKPNLMFLLDTSGSMSSDFMPDYVGDGTALCKSSGSSLQGCNNPDPAFSSAQFNGIYYNPAITYSPAVNYDGTVRTSYGSPWTSVPVDAYGIESGSNLNLVTSWPDTVYCNTSSPTTANRTAPIVNATNTQCKLPVEGGVWTYPNSTFNRAFSVVGTSGPYYYTMSSVTWCSSQNAQGFGTGTCQAKKTSTFQYPNFGTITRTDIKPATTTYTRAASRTDCAAASTCTYAEEMTNFANWYAYYHTRIQMMKSATGRAFSTVTDKYRVGMITINPGSPVNSSYYLPVSDFTAGSTGQKQAWYSKFYSQATGSSTPLRTALSRVGRYFAGMQDGINNGITDDPMQYYCQPNFTIMSTDGLWNDTSNPVKIDGSTAIGDQDFDPAVTPRPLLDSTGTSTSTSITTRTLEQKLCTGNGAAGFSTASGGLDTPCGCSGAKKKIVQRQLDSTTTTTVTAGVTSTATTLTSSFSDIVACNAGTDVSTTTTPVNTTEAKVCVYNGTVTFTSGNTFTCSCVTGSGTRKVLVMETISGGTLTAATDDGVSATTVTGGTSTLTFSTNGSSFGGTPPTGSSCASGTTTLNNVAFSSSGGTSTTTSTSGTTVTTAMITLSPNPKTVTLPATTTTANVGAPNTLADVAQYNYWATDLRANGSLGAPIGTSATQLDVGTGDPSQPATTIQRMTTFTVGLGVDGTLTYKPDYDTNPTGDFLAIKNGTANWPIPVSNTITTVDDLWHAAVNGRGKYFSAQDPAAVAAGISSALQGVSAVVGAAAAAATSNLEPVAGDNFAFIASYETVRWNGEVEARTIDLTNGQIGATNVWSAQAQLDAVPYTSRVIKRFNATSSNKLQDFTYGNLSATEQAWFNSPYISTGTTGLSQWSTLSPTNQTAAQGSNLINFLRGDTSLEATVFRDRAHVLGDIVNAQPVFERGVPFSYTDTGYATFATCANTGGGGCPSNLGTVPRPSTLYVASNDGMLHALDASTGAERWAYIPGAVMPNLFRLADADYANRHLYTTDGTPTLGNVYDPGTSKWRTILVGGLNSGGRAYYALDVTDPANPISLWEFNVRATASCPSAVVLGSSKDDCDLGLTYGNPVISKLGDGTWAVMVTSGYNNVSPGDGKGYLYVLDPITGVIKKKIQASNISTQGINPGNTTTPTGLAKIANFVDDITTNNTTLRVYGGDLQGNLWRFNVDTGTAFVLAQLKDASSVAQPVTTIPELGEVVATPPVEMVYVGTGEYLGTTDLPNTQVQTIYGIKDATSGVAPATPVNGRGSTVVAQTLTNAVDVSGNGIRQVTSNPVDVKASGTNGWRIDLPTSGERISINPQLQLGTLIFASTIPTNSVCEPGGASFLNFVDYRTGSYVPGATTAGAKSLVGQLVGLNIVRLPDGKTVAIGTGASKLYETFTPSFSAPNVTGRRTGLRELSQ